MKRFIRKVVNRVYFERPVRGVIIIIAILVVFVGGYGESTLSIHKYLASCALGLVLATFFIYLTDITMKWVDSKISKFLGIEPLK